MWPCGKMILRLRDDGKVGGLKGAETAPKSCDCGNNLLFGHAKSRTPPPWCRDGRRPASLQLGAAGPVRCRTAPPLVLDACQHLFWPEGDLGVSASSASTP